MCALAKEVRCGPFVCTCVWECAKGTHINAYAYVLHNCFALSTLLLWMRTKDSDTKVDISTRIYKHLQIPI